MLTMRNSLNSTLVVSAAVVLLCACVQEAEGGILQGYSVYNRHQCHRLCWYRKPCSAFSIPRDVTVVKGGVNCLIYTGTVDDVPEGWVSQPATNEGIGHGCRLRRCHATEICVPVVGSDSQYRCLLAPVDCGPPTPPDNGYFTVTGTAPGHTAALQCRDHFAAWPQGGTTRTVTCTDRGSWTALQASCRQVSFVDGLAIPFLAQLPWPIVEGWEACVKGTFLGNTQMVINFLSDQEDYPNMGIGDYRHIIAQIAFRLNMDDITESLLYTSKKDWSWTTISIIPNNPLAPGDPFRLTLMLNASCLVPVLQGTPFTACLPWRDALHVPLTSAVYLGFGRDLSLDYVNLVSAQNCL